MCLCEVFAKRPVSSWLRWYGVVHRIKMKSPSYRVTKEFPWQAVSYLILNEWGKKDQELLSWSIRHFMSKDKITNFVPENKNTSFMVTFLEGLPVGYFSWWSCPASGWHVCPTWQLVMTGEVTAWEHYAVMQPCLKCWMCWSFPPAWTLFPEAKPPNLSRERLAASLMKLPENY